MDCPLLYLTFLSTNNVLRTHRSARSCVREMRTKRRQRRYYDGDDRLAAWPRGVDREAECQAALVAAGIMELACGFSLSFAGEGAGRRCIAFGPESGVDAALCHRTPWATATFKSEGRDEVQRRTAEAAETRLFQSFLASVAAEGMRRIRRVSEVAPEFHWTGRARSSPLVI